MLHFSSCSGLVVVFVLTASALAADARAAERLAWKLKAGDRLQVTTDQTVATNTTYTGAVVESTMIFRVDSQWEVTGVADNQFELAQKVTRARVEMRTPKSDPLIYDSADEKRPTGAVRQLQAAVQPLIGLSAKVKMTERGEIVSAELPPELSQSAKSEGKENTPALSSETIKSLLSKALLILPEGNVDVGATWEGAATSSLPIGDIKTEKTYKLASIDEAECAKVARIEAEGNVQVTTKGKLKVTDSQFQQTALFAIDDGIVTSSEQSVKMKTESPYRETTIVVDMEMTLKTTITRAD
jgi:hypothetical protein